MLIVQVRTDLVPGRDFVSILVTEGGRGVSTRASDSNDWGAGVRVAELPGTRGDRLRLTVEAIDPDGAVLVGRPVRAELRSGVETVTVLLTVACGSVMCPSAADAPDATACVAGRCVPEDCVVENPEVCGPPECTTMADCMAASECARASCAGGVCFQAPTPDACADGEICDVAVGCVAPSTGGPFEPRGTGHALVHIYWEGEGTVLRIGLDSGAVEDLGAHVNDELGMADPVISSGAVSPNGRWVSMLGQNLDLFRIDIDGIEPALFVAAGPFYPERQTGSVTDDGQTLLVTGGTVPGRGIYVLTESGGTLTPGPDLAALSPHAWNAFPRFRGSEIVFGCADHDFYGAGVCAVDAAGGAVRVLAAPEDPADNTYVSAPTVETTGDVLFARSPEGAPASEILRIPAAGGSAEHVADLGYQAEPCALPDGRYVILDRTTLNLTVARDAEVLSEIPFGASVRPGMSYAYLSSCSP